MDVFYGFIYGTAAWLSLQALPLIIMPKAIIGLLAKEVHQTTDTEIYFSRSFGFAILFIAIIGLFFTGVIPLSSSISEPLTLNNNDPKAPYALPVIWIMTLFHGTCLIYNYVRWVGSQQVGYTLGAVGSGGLAAVGIWLLVFGATPSHLSKRTGADKRMTGFPFQNTAAYDKKKDKKMG